MSAEGEIGARRAVVMAEKSGASRKGVPRPFQFSLATLLGVFTLVAIAIPFLMPAPRMSDDPWRLRQAIMRVGGTVPTWGEGKRIAMLSGSRITDHELAAMQSHRQFGFVFNDLTEIYLDGTGVTDESIKVVNQVRGLRKLSLSGCSITDAGIQTLERTVLILDLSGTNVTDKCLENRRWHVLWRLDLSGCNIGDAGIRSILAANPPDEIIVSNCPVSIEACENAKKTHPNVVIIRE